MQSINHSEEAVRSVTEAAYLEEEVFWSRT
jgi:hypothetical protein